MSEPVDGRIEREKDLLISKIRNVVEKGGVVQDFSAEISRLLEIGGKDETTRDLYQRIIENATAYASKGIEGTLWEVSRPKLRNQIASLLAHMTVKLDDPVFYVENLIELVRRVHSAEGRPDDLAVTLFEFLESELEHGDSETVLALWKIVRGRELKGEEDEVYQTLIYAYEQKARQLEGYQPLLRFPDPRKEERTWFSVPNADGEPLPVHPPKELLPEGSIPPEGKAPVSVIVTGPLAAGKTRYRHKEFPDCVAIDPPDVYRHITGGDRRIPENIGLLLQSVGRGLALQAIFERRNIVFEVVPTEDIQGVYEKLIGQLKKIGYRIELVYLDADRETWEKRNRSRGLTNVSCWFTEGDTMEWLGNAAKAALAADSATRGGSSPYTTITL